jgi:hypothetical protein
MAKCANPVSPQGGPKDKVPPKILNIEPDNFTTRFNTNEIKIEFNEYIQLRNVYKQMLISPPLTVRPEIKIKKKSVIIKLKKDIRLNENTTYTIFLGDAIVDLTESNPYKNFEYVFSTGDYVDSLSYAGIIKDAFTNKPVENVAIMLYASDIDTIPLDSMPILIRPNYVAQTDKEGKFQLNNLRDVPYKVFALNDKNSNYLYDVISEEIAFLDTLVNAYYTGPNKQSNIADSLKTDSISLFNYEKIQGELFMFVAQDSIQDIVDSKIEKKYQLKIILKYPCQSYSINPINFNPDRAWKIDEPNKTNDTIKLWIKPHIQDTIKFEFLADNQLLDTLTFVLKKKKRIRAASKKKKKQKMKVKKKIERIKIKNNIKSSKAELNKKVQFTFDYPLEKYDFSSFTWMEDSVAVDVPVLFADSTKRKVFIDKELDEKVKYKLIIPDSTFYTLHGLTNDSIILSFTPKSIEDYGNLTLTVKTPNNRKNWIIQILKNDKVIRERKIEGNQELKFDYMQPGKYKIKAIHDKNKNGHWDTGNYTFKRQAEKIIFFTKEIDLRANWNFEEEFEIK